MKPVSVRFKCFGPYMDEQFIDFTELEKNGLFLICGETGAGKTTILDAICYALYCESSGGLRGDIENMRCKLAEKSDETFVEFIFDSNGRRYKFSRAMKYKTKNLHKYHNCYVLNGETWEVLDSDMKSVTARAEKLVGLTSSQFRQVIILPQGKFEEFLVSDSKKKEEILVTLFNVQQWSKISEEISRRVNARAAELNQEKTAIAEGLRRYGCDSLETLNEKKTALEESLEQTKLQTEAAEKELAGAEERFSAGKLEGELFAQLQRAQERFDNLKKQEAAMELEERALAKADLADTLRPGYNDYRNAATAKQKAEKELTTAKSRLEKGRTALSQAEENLAAHQRLQDKHSDNQKLHMQLEQAREVYASLEGLNAEWFTAQNNWTAAEKNLKDQTAMLDKRDRELLSAFEAQKLAKEEYDAAQTAYRLGIGGILAETLREGKACPVCGSLIHPDPAKKADNHVSEAKLDKLNKALNQCGKAVSTAMKARTQAEAARNAAQEGFHTTSQKLSSVTERLNLAKEQRIQGIETMDALEANLRELNRKIQSYETRGRELLDRKTAAEAACAAAELSLRDWETQLAAAAEGLEGLSAQWNRELKESGFGTEEAFLKAWVEPAKKQKRYQLLTIWKADVKSAEETLEEQKQKLSGKTMPDLKALKQLRDQAEQNFRSLSKAQILDSKLLKDMRTDEKKLASRLEANRESLIRLEADQVFARRLSGSHGVGLQRYVLGVMMNSITIQANRLLENVYGGRYRLYRTDEKTGSAQKRGLELEVSDSQNNQRRSVRTLSGGEKFLVALSLAIGLSTVVQAQGEGIRLEAMFIDEGFGSLDRESIQDALDILQSIRRTAGVVGIISHVEALAETIPGQIRITKGKNGSRCHITGL